MAKKWIITSSDQTNPIPGNKALITSQRELDQRMKAAKAAGVHVDVREAE